MSIEDWSKQLKKGSLEYCILLLIKEKPCYGYEIMNELSTWPITTAKESTIYPLLRRLLDGGSVEANWQQVSEGLPPRKYYSITDEGRKYLDEMSEEWNKLNEAVSELRRGA
ncbi:MAG: PadR family transcriptional regulator [Raoultibacter sp.]|jgi:PadR family transcriptional regulator PadR